MTARTCLGAGVSALALLLAGAACSPAADRATVVVTTNILGDVVRQMVGDSMEVLVLMKPNADPHSFGVSAKEAGAMQSADLIVANGLGLEEGLVSNLENARTEGVRVLEVGEHIDPLDYTEGETAGAPDPHFWTDPSRMATAIDVIAEALGEKPGSEARDLAARTEEYRAEVTALDEELGAEFAALPEERRKLITNHHVFGYLADRYDFDVIGAVLPSGTTLASPSAADLEDLAQVITDAQVPAIFADSSQPQRLAEVLAQEAGVGVSVVALHSESLTDAEGEAPTYLDMQRLNAERIVDGLGA